MSDLVGMVERAIDPNAWTFRDNPTYEIRREDSRMQARAAIEAVAEWIDEHQQLDRDGSVHRALTRQHKKKPKAAT